MKDIIVDDNKEKTINQKETIDNIVNEFNLHNVSIRTTVEDKVFIAGTSKNKYLVKVSIEPLYMKETIKECIRLHNQGYTQTDIADKLNISQGTVSNYLHKYVLIEDKKKENNN